MYNAAPPHIVLELEKESYEPGEAVRGRVEVSHRSVLSLTSLQVALSSKYFQLKQQKGAEEVAKINTLEVRGPMALVPENNLTILEADKTHTFDFVVENDPLRQLIPSCSFPSLFRVQWMVEIRVVIAGMPPIETYRSLTMRPGPLALLKPLATLHNFKQTFFTHKPISYTLRLRRHFGCLGETVPFFFQIGNESKMSLIHIDVELRQTLRYPGSLTSKTATVFQFRETRAPLLPVQPSFMTKGVMYIRIPTDLIPTVEEMGSNALPPVMAAVIPNKGEKLTVGVSYQWNFTFATSKNDFYSYQVPFCILDSIDSPAFRQRLSIFSNLPVAFGCLPLSNDENYDPTHKAARAFALKNDSVFPLSSASSASPSLISPSIVSPLSGSFTFPSAEAETLAPQGVTFPLPAGAAASSTPIPAPITAPPSQPQPQSQSQPQTQPQYQAQPQYQVPQMVQQQNQGQYVGGQQFGGGQMVYAAPQGVQPYFAPLPHGSGPAPVYYQQMGPGSTPPGTYPQMAPQPSSSSSSSSAQPQGQSPFYLQYPPQQFAPQGQPPMNYGAPPPGFGVQVLPQGPPQGPPQGQPQGQPPPGYYFR